MRGIETAGAYLPRFRLDGATLRDVWGHSTASNVEMKTVAAADEDAVTMAVAASEAALKRSTVEATAVTKLCFASTTPPLDEEMIAPRIARALGVPPSAEVAESTQSTLGGAEVISSALATDGVALVAIADEPMGAPANADHPLGAAGVAFVVSDSPSVTVLDRAFHSDEAPGVRYRERGDRNVRSLDNNSYERSTIRNSVATAVERLEEPVDNASAAVLPQPNAGVPYRVARSLPVSTDAVEKGVIVNRVGDAGAATVPLGLLSAFANADSSDRILGGFFASGSGAAVMMFQGGVTSGVGNHLEAGEDVSYPRYLRERGYIGRRDVAGGGAHVSMPSWLQTLDSRYRLVAGRCPACGGLSFPPSGACQHCHEMVDFDRVALPREGTVEVHTVIEQGGSPPEFAEQQQRDGPYAIATVAIEADAGTVTIPGQLADVDPETVESGDCVRATIRRIYETEGIPRYGRKFVPADRPL